MLQKLLFLALLASIYATPDPNAGACEITIDVYKGTIHPTECNGFKLKHYVSTSIVSAGLYSPCVKKILFHPLITSHQIVLTCGAEANLFALMSITAEKRISSKGYQTSPSLEDSVCRAELDLKATKFSMDCDHTVLNKTASSFTRSSTRNFASSFVKSLETCQSIVPIVSQYHKEFLYLYCTHGKYVYFLKLTYSKATSIKKEVTAPLTDRQFAAQQLISGLRKHRDYEPSDLADIDINDYEGACLLEYDYNKFTVTKKGCPDFRIASNFEYTLDDKSKTFVIQECVPRAIVFPKRDSTIFGFSCYVDDKLFVKVGVTIIEKTPCEVYYPSDLSEECYFKINYATGKIKSSDRCPAELGHIPVISSVDSSLVSSTMMKSVRKCHDIHVLGSSQVVESFTSWDCSIGNKVYTTSIVTF